MMDNERAWELWAKQFENAKKFFKSKGNVQSRGRLKKKWMDSFYEALNEVASN